jgi:hypothetical protein
MMDGMQMKYPMESIVQSGVQFINQNHYGTLKMK